MRHLRPLLLFSTLAAFVDSVHLHVHLQIPGGFLGAVCFALVAGWCCVTANGMCPASVTILVTFPMSLGSTLYQYVNCGPTRIGCLEITPNSLLGC